MPATRKTTVVADTIGKVLGLVLIVAASWAICMCAAWLLLQLGRVLFGGAA